MKLIIIESPNKIPSYRKYLGNEYSIEASYGHVVDLPVKELGVDVKNEFKPTFEVMDAKKDVIHRLIEKAKQADMVYLMTDPDREGEGIASNIADNFPKSVYFKRASTASITKQAILDAIANAGEINRNMVDSYETRRILDRLAGYKTSFIVKMATGGRSAGRVQSAALRILAEREKEIQEFKPVEYWPVEADLLTKDKKEVLGFVVVPDKMDIGNEATAKSITNCIETGLVKVSAYDVKTVNRNPFPPFMTSTLQAAASGMFGWDQKHTMSVAQNLYTQGSISYMRTDSTHIVPEHIQNIRSAITSKYGEKYLPDKQVFYKAGKNAQEAHEAIRPTDIAMETTGNGDETKLYKLIWKRTVASQMMPEIREQVRAEFSVVGSNPEVKLAASGGRQVFDGWKKCWDYREAGDTFLPAMKIGDNVEVIAVRYEQKFTEPPPRYGVASFNKKLEDTGIARPSTLANLTETLKDREYVEVENKVFHVTPLGMKVVDFLVKVDFCFADTSFTRQMEDDLDDILSGGKNKVDVLTKFYDRLKIDLKKAQEIRPKQELSGFKCPQCKEKGEEKFLVKRESRFGKFFSCQAFKQGCTYKADVGPDDSPTEKVQKEKAKPSGFKCPKCGNELVHRSGSYGDFLGCSGFPKCRTVADLGGNIKDSSKKPSFRRGKYKKKGKT